MMNLDRFAALVDAYGSSPERWPEAERAAAMELLRTSPEAQRLAHEADTLDRLLDAPETAPATRQLEERIFAAFAPRAAAVPRRRAPLWMPSRWLPAGAVGCALVLGILVGSQVPRLAGLDDDTLAQDAATSAMTASATDGDSWIGGVE